MRIDNYSHGLLLTLLDFPNPFILSFILGAHGLSINSLLSLLSLLWVCCGPFLPFYLTYCPWVFLHYCTCCFCCWIRLSMASLPSSTSISLLSLSLCLNLLWKAGYFYFVWFFIVRSSESWLGVALNRVCWGKIGWA